MDKQRINVIEKAGHIKNPLTVIAIFAGIAEISGTIVLPFIANENQAVYIWFLMIFPLFLVGIFFGTLNFNHKVLYAPSDYSNEDNFIKSIGKATIAEKQEKLRAEANDASALLETSLDPETLDASVTTSQSQTTEAEGSQADENSVPKTPLSEENGTAPSGYSKEEPGSVRQTQDKQRRAIEQVQRVETLAITKLSEELGMMFQKDASFDVHSRRKLIFDGLGISKDTIHAVEVKFLKTANSVAIASGRFEKLLLECENLNDQIKIRNSSSYLLLHFFVVIEDSSISKDSVTKRFERYRRAYDVNVDLRVLYLTELEKIAS
jgi:hypothetical protein